MLVHELIVYPLPLITLLIKLKQQNNYNMHDRVVKTVQVSSSALLKFHKIDLSVPRSAPAVGKLLRESNFDKRCVAFARKL